MGRLRVVRAILFHYGCCLWLLSSYVAATAVAAGAFESIPKTILELTKKTAELSILMYEDHPTDCDYCDSFALRDASSDRVVLVQVDGICLVVFRGTELSVEDWMQNLNPFSDDYCDDVSGVTACCGVRRGFQQNYDSFGDGFAAAIDECRSICQNKESGDCLYFGGHSQGGAVAQVAAMIHHEWNPTVLALATPPSIHRPCKLIHSERWYSFINSRASNNNWGYGLVYDTVPTLTGLGADHWGEAFLLSPDNTGLAYLGRDTIGPVGIPHQVNVHALYSGEGRPNPGYLDRINAILARTTSGDANEETIRTTGIVAGLPCNHNAECMDGICWDQACLAPDCRSDGDCWVGMRCHEFRCQEKLDACAQCDGGGDCQSGQCHLGRCANEDGLLDTGCFCLLSSDCASGRCEGVVDWTCVARLSKGDWCNEDSDCSSNQCSWRFKCE